MKKHKQAWPIPWQLVDEDHEDAEWCEVLDADGDSIPFLSDIYYEDNPDQTTEVIAAKAMVEAVNNYPALLAAARVVVERRGEAITGGSGVDYYEIDTDAIDALAALLPDAGAEPGGGGES